jgi:hypothetical protein
MPLEIYYAPGLLCDEIVLFILHVIKFVWQFKETS